MMTKYAEPTEIVEATPTSIDESYIITSSRIIEMQLDDTTYETDQALFRACSLVAVSHQLGVHIEKSGDILLAKDGHGTMIAKLIPLTNGSVWAMEFSDHDNQLKKVITDLLNKTSADIEIAPAEFWDDALSAIEHVESLLDEADSLARTVVEYCEVVRCVPLPPPMDVHFVPLPPPVVEQPPTPIWETEEDMVADLMGVEVYCADSEFSA